MNTGSCAHTKIEKMTLLKSVCWLLLISVSLSVTYAQPPDSQREGQREGRRGDDNGRRNWDPSQFLSRLDRNEDGVLDANELAGRARGFVEQQGFDVSNGVAVKAILDKLAADRQRREDEERRRQRDEARLVPKFGEDVEWPTVAGFKSAKTGSIDPNEDIGKQFEENIVDQVDRTFDRFDRNRDGVLDREENRRLRWDSLGVDLDNDGTYTRREIAEFFKRRDQQNRAGESTRGGREFAGGGRSSTPSVQNAESGATTVTTRLSNSSSANRSLDSRVISYVDNIYKKYDGDSDGLLSKQEMKDVRIPFRDSNNDGQISRDEAMEYVGGARSSSSKSAAVSTAAAGTGGNVATSRAAVAGSTSVRRDINGWGRVGSDSQSRDNDDQIRSRGVSANFFDYDRNDDGQIQMMEFARPDEWTDAKLAEYYSYDHNRDGVITSREWSARSNR